MSKANLNWENFLELKKNAHPICRFSVVTGSMEPLIPIGASIIVDTQTDFKENDIIVFWQNDKLIVHILWKINSKIMKGGKNIFATRSMNSKVLDTSISRDQILGKVVNYKLGLKEKIKLYLFQKLR